MEFPKINETFFKGRGAQINPFNPFHDKNYIQEHIEGLDEEMLGDRETLFFTENAKKVVNKVESPDAAMMYSVNPYQGCEHGCVYCFARNTHNYWGFSAGLDFETRIIIKHNAADLLEKVFIDPKWMAAPISFSGNTDCYQPIERKMKITRKLLEVSLKYKNPASIITKNQLILRDIDILQELAKDDLTHVFLSITSLKEEIRQKMEPRTATYKARLKTIEKLTSAGVPVGIMIRTCGSRLTDSEIPDIIKSSSRSWRFHCGL
ncbi:MAG: radical SAM protein [Bacteroidetes bacterium]|nr:radical SAM protein [Bacteroidota bacterium]